VRAASGILVSLAQIAANLLCCGNLSRLERCDNSKRAAFPMIEQEPYALRAQLSRCISLAQSDAAKRRSELGPGLPGVDQPQPQVRDCITTPNTKSSHRLIQDGPRVRAELLSNGERVQLRSKSVFPNESGTATNVCWATNAVRRRLTRAEVPHRPTGQCRRSFAVLTLKQDKPLNWIQRQMPSHVANFI
jgi:hypothetical protein